MAASGSNGDTSGGTWHDGWNLSNGHWHHPRYGWYQAAWEGSEKGEWKGSGWTGGSTWHDSHDGWNKQDHDKDDSDMGLLPSVAAGHAAPHVPPTPVPKTRAMGLPSSSTHLADDAQVLGNDGLLDLGNDSWEGQAFALLEAKVAFWDPESKVRVNCSQLTPYEIHQLKETFPLLLNDINKMIKFFGQPKGAGSAAKRLVKHIAELKGMGPGVQCAINTAGFSICKHLMVSAWNDVPPEVPSMQFPRCNCFPKTALMPCGCEHTRVCLWKYTYYPVTLCRHCSVCVRCDGFLGIMSFCSSGFGLVWKINRK